MSNQDCALRAGKKLALMGLALIGAFAASSGCEMKDDQKCEEAITHTRESLAARNLDLARKWREYAYKQCEDTVELQEMDQAIVAKQEEIAQAESEAKAKKQETEQLLKVFVNFAASNQKTPERAANAPSCPSSDDKKKQDDKQHWCVATRRAGQNHVLEAHYWEAEPEAVRFSTRFANPISCDDLGPNNVTKTLSVPTTSGASAQRQYCQFTGGSLSGLHALVTQAHDSEAHIFSAKYLQRDAVMRQRIGLP